MSKENEDKDPGDEELIRIIKHDDLNKLIIESDNLFKEIEEKKDWPIDQLVMINKKIGLKLLRMCCTFDSVECAEALIDGKIGLGLEVNITDEWGRAAIHYASEMHSKRCVKMLLNRKARTDLKSREALIPIQIALLSGRLKVWDKKQTVGDLLHNLTEMDLSVVKMLAEKTTNIADIAYATAIEGRIVPLAALLMVVPNMVTDPITILREDGDLAVKETTTIYQCLVKEVSALGQKDDSVKVSRRLGMLSNGERREMLLQEIQLFQILGAQKSSISPPIPAFQGKQKCHQCTNYRKKTSCCGKCNLHYCDRCICDWYPWSTTSEFKKTCAKCLNECSCVDCSWSKENHGMKAGCENYLVETHLTTEAEIAHGAQQQTTTSAQKSIAEIPERQEKQERRERALKQATDYLHKHGLKLSSDNDQDAKTAHRAQLQTTTTLQNGSSNKAQASEAAQEAMLERWQQSNEYLIANYKESASAKARREAEEKRKKNLKQQRLNRRITTAAISFRLTLGVLNPSLLNIKRWEHRKIFKISQIAQGYNAFREYCLDEVNQHQNSPKGQILSMVFRDVHGQDNELNQDSWNQFQRFGMSVRVKSGGNFKSPLSPLASVVLFGKVKRLMCKATINNVICYGAQATLHSISHRDSRLILLSSEWEMVRMKEVVDRAQKFGVPYLYMETVAQNVASIEYNSHIASFLKEITDEVQNLA